MMLLAVDSDLLHEHASKVTRIGDDVHLAVDAANSISMTGGAFGLMCQFMVPAAVITSELAKASLRSAADMVDRTSAQVRVMSDNFVRCEEDVKDSISHVERRLL